MDFFWLVLQLLLRWMLTPENVWLGLGFLAQGLFASRFIIQWISSERVGHSVVPVGFWFLSLAGGGMLFSYALYRRDPVFIMGQGTGLFVYFRNLYMILRDQRNEKRKLFSPASFLKP